MRNTYLSDSDESEYVDERKSERKSVKMLVLGAPRVGKTSFITRLTKGYFTMYYVPTKLIEIYREVEIGDMIVTCWDIPAKIRYHFKLTCLTADVVLLMFDSGRPETKKIVFDYWEKIHEQLDNIPYVFVVGVRTPEKKEQGIYYIDNMSTVGYNELLYDIQNTIL
jgi:GTPase SAR1 family protein